MTDQTESLPMVTALLFACDQLNLYRAELARILGLHCNDVSDAKKLEQLLDENEHISQQASRFLLFFDALQYRFTPGNSQVRHTQQSRTGGVDETAMVHWFRKPSPQLGTTPFLAIVDEGRLEHVIQLLKEPAQSNAAITRQA